MSVRATVWAWEQDAQANALLVLLAYADEADDSGTYRAGSQEEIMLKTGLSERAVRDNAQKLEDAIVLKRHPRYEAGRRVPDIVKLAVDGTVLLPAEIAAGEDGEKPPAKSAGGKVQAKSHRQNLPGSSSSTPTSEKSEGRGRARRNLPLVGDVPDSMLADAQTLLDRKTRVGSQLVTPEEMALAVAALAEFNRLAEYDFGLGAHLRALVGRVRERPSFGAAEYTRLTQSAWRMRWWEKRGNSRRPTPAVIYGNTQVFEQVIADAADEKNGRSTEGQSTRRFERKGPRRAI